MLHSACNSYDGDDFACHILLLCSTWFLCILVGRFGGDFACHFAGDFACHFAGDFACCFAGDFACHFAGDFACHFAGDFACHFAGDFACHLYVLLLCEALWTPFCSVFACFVMFLFHSYLGPLLWSSQNDVLISFLSLRSVGICSGQVTNFSGNRQIRV